MTDTLNTVSHLLVHVYVPNTNSKAKLMGHSMMAWLWLGWMNGWMERWKVPQSITRQIMITRDTWMQKGNARARATLKKHTTKRWCNREKLQNQRQKIGIGTNCFFKSEYMLYSESVWMCVCVCIVGGDVVEGMHKTENCIMVVK